MTDFRVIPSVGSGWALAAGRAVMYLPGPEEPRTVAPGQLFLAAGGGWEALARILVAVERGDSSSWPSFAVAVTGTNAVVGATVGVTVSVNGLNPNRGRAPAVTWSAGPDDVVVLGDAEHVEPSVLATNGVDLVEGSVRSGSVTICAESSSLPVDGPAASYGGPAGPPPPASQIGSPDEGATSSIRVQAPIPPPAARTPAAAQPGIQVQGVACARGHFNDPRARYCRVCGLAMHQASHVLVEGPRPPLGVLVWDTGQSDQIDRDLVVGREPATDALVVSGRADGLVPAGAIAGLSRVHAHLRLRGWDVVLSDSSSSNGTFVWMAEQSAWRRLAPGEEIVLQAGTTLAFAERIAVFESGLSAT